MFEKMVSKRGSARRPTNLIWNQLPVKFSLDFLAQMRDYIMKLVNPIVEDQNPSFFGVRA